MTAPRPGLRLIVNGDDYGLTADISRAVLDAHDVGVVTSTSVVVTTAAFGAAAEALRTRTELGVGLHLALVGGDEPAAPPDRIPSLVDAHGRLLPSWRAFLASAATGRVDAAHVRIELEAQHDRIRGAGLEPRHLDSHQNVHLWPAAAAVVVALAREWGIASIRTPDSDGRGPRGVGLRLLSRRLRTRLASAGLHTTDAMVGLDGADRYATRVVADLQRLRARADDRGGLVAELALHLSHPGDADLAAYGWGYDYAGALAAVLGPEVRRELGAPGVELVTWTQARQAA
ncbi:MAG: ChbG/HpnK family deacetylase [Actinobacteria bacterium]|nr:ChbG/HpnK family deacetylase [Actinomycetota bacterium]